MTNSTIERLKEDLKLYREKLFSEGLVQEEYEDLIKIEARILQHQEDVLEFEKKIDNLKKYYEIGLTCKTSESHKDIFRAIIHNLEELKKSLKAGLEGGE